MKLILCRKKSIGSWVLRSYMGSRWSHAAIWDYELDIVYDTTLHQGGCKKHLSKDFFEHYPTYRVIDLDVKDLEAARKWLENELGKLYDWSALVGIFFRTSKLEDNDAAFCSEQATEFISEFDHPLFNELACRITPYMLDIIYFDNIMQGVKK